MSHSRIMIIITLDSMRIASIILIPRIQKSEARYERDK